MSWPTAERRKRISERASRAFFDEVMQLPITIEEQRDDSVSFSLARTHSISFYDACYHELAVRTSSPLATLDKKLRAAAVAEGVALMPA